MIKVTNPFTVKLSSILISLMALTSFFAVSIFPLVVNYIFVIGFIILGLIRLIHVPFLNKKIFLFFLFAIAPILIGVFSLLPSMHFNSHGIDYSDLSMVGRLVNASIFFTTILLIHRVFDNNIDLSIFKWYWIGCLIFLFFALWHAVAIYTTLLNFPFETRSHIHSAGGVNLLATQRVTGIAQEPSYFVPFVVDFIILTLLLVSSIFKRFFLISFAVVLLFLSLSPSGFMILFGSLSGALSTVFVRYLLYRNIKAKHLFVFVFLLVVCGGGCLYFINTNAFEYIINRFANIDVESSARFYMVVMPFVWMQDSNIFTFLLGNGIKTYSIIGTEFLLPSGLPVHVTSNNFFTDTFWESGFIGLLTLISFFLYLFIKVMKLKFTPYQLFIAAMILFDLFFSSLVRADFASLRFFLMLYFLFILLNYDMRGLLWKRY